LKPSFLVKKRAYDQCIREVEHGYFSPREGRGKGKRRLGRAHWMIN